MVLHGLRNIFIGCSTKALVYRDRVELILRDLNHKVIHWEEPGTFIAGNIPLSDLERTFQSKADAGIFIVAPDDLLLTDDNKNVKIASVPFG